MNILIVGAGIVGFNLAQELSHEGHDISIIDLNRELCEAVSTELGVAAICGTLTRLADEAPAPRIEALVRQLEREFELTRLQLEEERQQRQNQRRVRQIPR